MVWAQLGTGWKCKRVDLALGARSEVVRSLSGEGEKVPRHSLAEGQDVIHSASQKSIEVIVRLLNNMHVSGNSPRSDLIMHISICTKKSISLVWLHQREV